MVPCDVSQFAFLNCSGGNFGPAWVSTTIAQPTVVFVTVILVNKHICIAYLRKNNAAYSNDKDRDLGHPRNGGFNRDLVGSTDCVGAAWYRRWQ